MKKHGIILLLLIIIGFTAGCTGNSPTNNTASTSTSPTTSKAEYVDVNGTRIYLTGIHFYMYGSKGCPHCGRMHEWIPREFGKNSLTYYELMNNETNMKLFGQLAQLTGITGVPAIGIAYNGTLMAVFEGEFNVSATPEIIATAIKKNGFILVVGGRGYLIPRDDPKAKALIDALQTLFVEHRSVDVQSVLAKLRSNSTG